MDQAEALRSALQRVRFERLMGLEFLPRRFMEPVPETVSEPAPRAAVSPVRTAAASDSAAPLSAISRPLSTLSNEERWKSVEARALACKACILHRARTNVVFGTGNKQAKLMFIGEGPGEDEDLSGQPFVGRAGKLLDKIIGAMGLRREDVYIANVVKCRPPMNRTPAPDEISACSGFLHEQIELVAPRVIVTLGAPATKTLLNTVAGIGALRGRWSSFRGIPVLPTFHPAFVLRTYTEEVRGQVWSDMKQVMAKLKDEQ